MNNTRVAGHEDSLDRETPKANIKHETKSKWIGDEGCGLKGMAYQLVNDFPLLYKAVTNLFLQSQGC